MTTYISNMSWYDSYCRRNEKWCYISYDSSQWFTLDWWHEGLLFNETPSSQIPKICFLESNATESTVLPQNRPVQKTWKVFSTTVFDCSYQHKLCTINNMMFLSQLSKQSDLVERCEWIGGSNEKALIRSWVVEVMADCSQHRSQPLCGCHILHQLHSTHKSDYSYTQSSSSCSQYMFTTICTHASHVYVYTTTITTTKYLMCPPPDKANLNWHANPVNMLS